MREEVEFRKPIITDANAVSMARAFIAPQDLGTPAGAIALRGATNFRTPPGWDTVYTPIFNMIERPVAPMLVVRVETDWYAHDTEFRYVLQPGEGMSLSHTLPIGQVVFVPREEITLAARHRRGARRLPRFDGPLQCGEGRAQADHALWATCEPALPATEPGAKGSRQRGDVAPGRSTSR